ncbi:MAG: hypothetical protein AB7K35_02965 [Pseudorhodoplanes sp.]
MTHLAGNLASALLLAALLASPAAAERATMPQGALVCRTIEPAIEHARIVRQPTTAGLRAFVEAQVASGACRVVRTEVAVVVVDVDRRGFALVDEGPNGRGWTDAENVWGYFDAPAKVKAWKKP